MLGKKLNVLLSVIVAGLKSVKVQYFARNTDFQQFSTKVKLQSIFYHTGIQKLYIYDTDSVHCDKKLVGTLEKQKYIPLPSGQLSEKIP